MCNFKTYAPGFQLRFPNCIKKALIEIRADWFGLYLAKQITGSEVAVRSTGTATAIPR